MSAIRKFFVKDVRCFKGWQEFDIRPLTFLVGENSTGKTTVLGCFQALSDYLRTDSSRYRGIDFNRPPYQMGMFEDIVRKTQKTKKRKFSLGFEWAFKKEEIAMCVDLAERKDSFEPIVKRVKFASESEEWIVDAENSGDRGKVRHPLSVPYDVGVNKKGRPVHKFKISQYEIAASPFSFDNFFMGPHHKESRSKSSEIKELTQWIHKAREITDISVSFSPTRSSPKRTYDPIKTEESLEGDDALMILAHISNIKSLKIWDSMRKKLTNFGKTSGLFSDVRVDRLRKISNAPFQLKVTVRSNPQVNLISVGYGVSQILPLLVHIFRVPRGTTFLMQEPEIHLHPKAQAELTSLFVSLTKPNINWAHSFIIETHSDYFIDRARIEIMKGNIKPDDVSLIYLEPDKRGNVKVHNIKFDKEGNMLGVPRSYGDFFLEETDRLLGFRS